MSSQDIDILHARLDTLWAEYLDALDKYTTSQDEVSKLLASGYFALAQANARRTTGRRYGCDWYDERSRATARVAILSDDSKHDGTPPQLTVQVQEVPFYLNDDVYDKEEQSKEAAPRSQHPVMLPTPSSTPEPGDDDKMVDRIKNTNMSDTKKRLQPDSASWYGLFVSPSLRQTQRLFKSAILGSVSTETSVDDSDTEVVSPMQLAVNAARDLRKLEMEIRAIRKALRRKSEK